MCALTPGSTKLSGSKEQGMSHTVKVCLSRTHNEDENSPNKLCMLVTYIPVTTLKNLQLNVVEN